MLHLKKIKSPQEARAYFNKSIFPDSSWIVSDLSSKLLLRQELLKQCEIIEDYYVLRAHELWRNLLLKNQPHLRIVSREYALQIIANKLRQYENLYKPGMSELVLNYIKHLLPVLSHQNGNEAIQDFFEKNYLSKKKWFHWYQLSNEIWRVFREQGIIINEWSSSYLVNQQLELGIQGKILFFNLGSNLQSSEAEIILNLSKNNEVTVFVPGSIKNKNLRAYELLDSSIFEGESSDTDSSKSHHIKLTTQLAEVKAACSIVRKWLDDGIELDKIAILAPDIGLYWPVLNEYLKTEGIPFKRSVMTPIKTFSEVQSWLSRMKIALSRGTSLNSDELESVLFDQESAKLIKYDEFKRLYSKIYDWSDLKRSPSVNNLISQAPTSSEREVSKENFLKWAVSLWEYKESSKLELILSSFYQETIDSLHLESQQWLEILDSIVSRKEVEVVPAATEGVFCLDISSAKEADIARAVVIGMSDNQMKMQAAIHIDDRDVYVLKQDYGFFIPFSEQSNIEFDAEWILRHKNVEYVLSYPKSDFDGNALSPSILWLKGALAEYGEDPDFYTEIETRQNQIQDLKIESIKEVKAWDVHRFNKIKDAISEDLGLKDFEAFKFQVNRLSPTAIEDYLKCPFIFSSKKVLLLSDLPDVDLDVDYMTRGRLIHEIFFKVLIEPFKKDYTDDEINNIIESARHSIQFMPADEKLWISIKKRYLIFTKKFIASEADWRRQFPVTKTKYKEVEVRGFISADNGNLVTEATEGSIPIYGKVDRVDVNDRNQALIIDYKYSTTKHKSYTGWIKAHELQLAIYALAIENGLLNGQELEVMGAIYFSIKEMERVKGFLVKTETGLYSTESRKRNLLETDEKNELISHLREELKKVLINIDKGIFYPAPEDQDTCTDCSWRDLCRAPHLN